MYRVLIVDDEKIVRIALKSMQNWEEEGFEVCAAVGDTDNALRVIDTCRPHLVITDIEMPGKNGIALMEQARAQGYTGEFLVLTNHQIFSYAVDALKNSAADYLIKTDISPQSLQNIIRKIHRKISNDCPAEQASGSPLLFPADIMQVKQCLQQRQAVGCTFSEPYFFFYIFLRSRLTHMRLEILPDTLKNLVCEAMHFAPERAFTITNDSVLLLIQQKEFSAFTARLDHHVMHVVQLVRLYMNTDCGFVCSGIVQTDGECLSELERCISAEKLVLYQGFGTVLEAHNLKGYLGIAEPIHTAYRNIKTCLSQNDFPAAEAALQAYLTGCIQLRVPPEHTLHAIDHLHRLLLIDNSLWIEKSRADELQLPGEYAQPVTLQEHLAYFHQLLHTIQNHKPDFSFCSHRAEISEICQFIQEHIKDHISLSMLSKSVNMTKNYISRLFKAETGMNLVNYINLMKLEQAKDRLSDFGDSVKTIAIDFGFDEPSYFNRLFVKTYGISPTEYRRLLREE